MEEERGFQPRGGDAGGGSPWVGVAAQVLFQVPENMLLRKEERHTQGQQLPALGGNQQHPFEDHPSGVGKKKKTPVASLTCVREWLCGVLWLVCLIS